MDHTKNRRGVVDNKILAVVLIVAIVALGIFIFGNGGIGTGATVSAQGTSVIEVEPDRVSVNLNVEARDELSQVAKEAHDVIVDDVVIQLLKLGVDRDEIKTQGFNIYPEYEYDGRTREQTGFVARQNIVVETEDFDLVTQIVDAAVAGGALVSWINFELSQEKQNEFKAQALEEAGEDARKKAEATASGLGKKLGKLVSVQGEEYRYGGPYIAYASAVEGGDAVEAQAAAVNLAPSDVEVRANVRVEYKVK